MSTEENTQGQSEDITPEQKDSQRPEMSFEELLALGPEIPQQYLDDKGMPDFTVENMQKLLLHNRNLVTETMVRHIEALRIIGLTAARMSDTLKSDNPELEPIATEAQEICNSMIMLAQTQENMAGMVGALMDFLEQIFKEPGGEKSGS